jgi:hypothetical protein
LPIIKKHALVPAKDYALVIPYTTKSFKMQLSKFGLVAALAFAHVTGAAVSISDLPECAVSCYLFAMDAPLTKLRLTLHR